MMDQGNVLELRFVLEDVTLVIPDDISNQLKEKFSSKPWVEKFAGFVMINRSIDNTPNVFPNPTHDVLKINTRQFSVTSIQIIDQLGRVLVNKAINSEGQVIISDLNEGVYYYKMLANNNTFYGKFVKH